MVPLSLPGALEARRAQMFPTLEDGELARLERFGQRRTYRDGEDLYRTGQRGPGLFVIFRGQATAQRRDGLGRAVPIVEQGPGGFLGEVGQLSGGPALADVRAVGEVEALVIPPPRLRALVVEEAELGERIMRALILRRMVHIELGGGGPILLGSPTDPALRELASFLERNSNPYSVLDPTHDEDAAILLAERGDALLALLPDGSVLENPSEYALARALGLLEDEAPKRLHDLAVVGAGPAGLAVAVYGASEGLDVVVLEARSFGGQAGASARIENYLGFPTGISGQALTGRAFVQAMKFGARMEIAAEVTGLEVGSRGGHHTLTLADGRQVQAATVVIATGARYRRPQLDDLAAFEGRGVSYWASPLEARMCTGEEVLVVGGGNSAGQAAVFLSGYARQVRLLVRGKSLGARMSSYLVARLTASPSIAVELESEVVALIGTRSAGLQRVRWQHRPSGRIHERPVRHLFLFIGADPATGWLGRGGVARDEKGFALTGRELASEPSWTGDSGRPDRIPFLLETSVPGIFAVGDVRAGSVKRVGGAIGEGAAVVAQIHAHLASRDRLVAPLSKPAADRETDERPSPREGLSPGP